MSTKPTTTVVQGRSQIVVPESVRRRAGLKSGDRVEFRAVPGVITIVTSPPAADKNEYTPEQRRVIDSRLAKADDDIKAGRLHGPFDTAEAMAASVEASIKKFRGAKRKPKPA